MGIRDERNNYLWKHRTIDQQSTSPSCHLLNNKYPIPKKTRISRPCLVTRFLTQTHPKDLQNVVPACSVTVLLKGHHSQQSFSGDVTSPGKFRIVKHVLSWISAWLEGANIPWLRRVDVLNPWHHLVATTLEIHGNLRLIQKIRVRKKEMFYLHFKAVSMLLSNAYDWHEQLHPRRGKSISQLVITHWTCCILITGKSSVHVQ